MWGGKDGRCNKTKKSLIERGIPSSDNQQTTFVPTTFLYERVEWEGQGLGEEREEGRKGKEGKEEGKDRRRGKGGRPRCDKGPGGMRERTSVDCRKVRGGMIEEQKK